MHEAGGYAGHAIAIVAVHAAIAYADALSIKAKGQKSKSGDHRDAADFLQDRIRIHTGADHAALGSLRALLRRKDQVSYADDLVRDGEASHILDDLARFANWAEERFTALP